MDSILTITLNPALDMTTSLDRLLPQQKLRCSAPRQDAGGGGVNVSRVIKELGGRSTAFVALGGHTGQQLRQLIATTGIPSEFFTIAGETRFSLTAMEETTGLHYRFVMPGPQVTEAETDQMLARLVRADGRSPPDLSSPAAACRRGCPTISMAGWRAGHGNWAPG